MTYEPGQQVLVRGEVDVVIKSETAILGYMIKGIEYPVHPDDIIGRADVVGPAPATPDEGAIYLALTAAEATIEQDEIDLHAVTAKLAAAEARIAAALAFHQPVPDDGGGWCECSYAYPCATRRALSVEAADTEDGD
jgi:hypothetical protein